MGAQRVRRLLLAAAAGALLASGAAADIYSYDSYWTYALPAYYQVQDLPFVSGDSSCLVVPVYNHRGIMGIHHLLCYKFSGNGTKIGEYSIFYNWVPYEAPYTLTLGAITFGEGVIVAYDIDYMTATVTSALTRSKPEWWDLREPGPLYFRILARPNNGSYFYNYRQYLGGMRVCKCRGDSTVISYFTPAGTVYDITVDGDGYVYIADYSLIRKYSESGSLLQSWIVPSGARDLTIDKWKRLLALANDRYTYVYNTAGVLLGSFTTSYGTEVYSADVGPGDQYYVMGTDYPSGRYIYVYRFTPDTTGVLPTSFGKIKAIYN